MIEKDLLVSFEELFIGCIKKMKILWKIYDECGIFMNEEKIFIVNIKLGWKVGIKIIFLKEGDWKLGIVLVDVVLIIKDKLYFLFKCDSCNNFFYIVKIFLWEVLIGVRVEVFIIDGRKIRLLFNEVVWLDFLSKI